MEEQRKCSFCNGEWFGLIRLIGACMLTRNPGCRWWLCHAVGNLIVVVFSVADVWSCMKNPLRASVGPYNMIPNYAIAAIHIYHMVAFNDLQVGDWVHHIVFGGIICSLGMGTYIGPVQNFVAIFLSGLPGGLDYCMLAAVKHKKLDPITEKRWNARINVWIRAPGCMMAACCLYVSGLAQPVPEGRFIIYCLAGIMTAFNGLYYMQVVVGNTFRKSKDYSC